MPATAQLQWYTSKMVIGGVVLPCFPPCSFNAPSNWIVPPLIGNYWQVNYGDGFIQPTVDVVFAIRDKTSEVLSNTVLGYWLSRTNDTAHDSIDIPGGISFWDGYRGWTCAHAKADSFTIGTVKGEVIRFTGRFCLSEQALGDIVAITSDPATGFVGWSTDNLLTFDAVTFDQYLDSQMWRMDFSFSNNHNPDMSLNGRRTPQNQNAGMMTVGLQLVCQARSDTVVAGALDSTDPGAIVSPGGVAQRTAMAMTINGTSSKTCTFNFSAPLNNNPYSRMVQPPRGMRNYDFVGLGSLGQVADPSSPGNQGMPLYVTGSGF